MAKFHNPLDKKNKKASGKGKVTRTTTNTANRKAVSTAVTAEIKADLVWVSSNRSMLYDSYISSSVLADY